MGIMFRAFHDTGHFVKFSPLVLIVGVLLLYGCSNTPYRGGDILGADEFVIDSYKIHEGKFSVLEMEGRSSPIFHSQYLEDYKDTLQDGDVLKVALFHPSRDNLVCAVQEISSTVGYSVRGNRVHLPGLAPIEVVGLTLDEAQDKIQKAYSSEAEGVEVFLDYQNREERKVQLVGMVGVPSIPVDGKLRLFEVLSEAKVPSHANFFKSYMLRGGDPVPVDMYKLMKEGDLSQNIVMRGGDKIYIAEPADSTLMVMGEVREEGIIEVPAGFLPLKEALAMAGGILATGDRGSIQVVRGNILCPKIYTLNWKHIMRLPTNSMLLIPGDVVYVAATPITEWNRLFSKILPTVTGVAILRKGIKGVVAAP